MRASLKRWGAIRKQPTRCGALSDLHQFRIGLSRVPKILDFCGGAFAAGEPELALKDIDEALKLWKDNPVAYDLAGLARERRENTRMPQREAWSMLFS